MESGEADKSSVTETQQEELYSVKLRTSLVDYVLAGLRPIYAAEQQEVQGDGNYKKVLEFNDSPFTELMGKLSPTHEDSGNQPSRRSIKLSEKDMALITKKLPLPTDYAGSRSYRETLKELRGSFQEAKNSAIQRKLISKVTRFFRRNK